MKKNEASDGKFVTVHRDTARKPGASNQTLARFSPHSCARATEHIEARCSRLSCSIHDAVTTATPSISQRGSQCVWCVVWGSFSKQTNHASDHDPCKEGKFAITFTKNNQQGSVTTFLEHAINTFQSTTGEYKSRGHRKPRTSRMAVPQFTSSSASPAGFVQSRIVT
jgi:hypothetical protein